MLRGFVAPTFVAWGLVTSLAVAQTNDGLRCDGRLVSLGETKPQVFAKCGEPSYKESRVETQTSPNGATLKVTIDEWTYQQSGSFPRLARFENGVLRSVVASGR